MQYLWVLLILVYGIVKGLRETLKKKAMETNSVLEVLFFYTLFAFLMTIPMSYDVFSVGWKFHIALIVKAGIIFIAWLCALNSIKRLPLSIYSVMDMGRVLFSVLLGIIFLGESIDILQTLGMIFVIIGITLVNASSKRTTNDKAGRGVVVLVLTSCLLNSVSGVMDKWILSTQGDRWFLGDATVTSSQVQFWYMLYLTALYGLYILIKREKINVKKCVRCPWIWILSAIFVIADKCLFIANSDPNSTVVAMTLIKQSSVLVTIAMGKIIYKEKDIFYRIFCALIIIVGISVSIF